MRLSKLRKLMIALLIGSLALCAVVWLLSKDSDLQTVCIILGSAAVALLVGFFVARLFWKCPHCKSLLPWKEGGHEIGYCPFCGKDVGND